MCSACHSYMNSSSPNSLLSTQYRLHLAHRNCWICGIYLHLALPTSRNGRCIPSAPLRSVQAQIPLQLQRQVSHSPAWLLHPLGRRERNNSYAENWNSCCRHRCSTYWSLNLTNCITSHDPSEQMSFRSADCLSWHCLCSCWGSLLHMDPCWRQLWESNQTDSLQSYCSAWPLCLWCSRSPGFTAVCVFVTCILPCLWSLKLFIS